MDLDDYFANTDSSQAGLARTALAAYLDKIPQLRVEEGLGSIAPLLATLFNADRVDVWDHGNIRLPDESHFDYLCLRATYPPEQAPSPLPAIMLEGAVGARAADRCVFELRENVDLAPMFVGPTGDGKNIFRAVLSIPIPVPVGPRPPQGAFLLCNVCFRGPTIPHPPLDLVALADHMRTIGGMLLHSVRENDRVIAGTVASVAESSTSFPDLLTRLAPEAALLAAGTLALYRWDPFISQLLLEATTGPIPGSSRDPDPTSPELPADVVPFCVRRQRVLVQPSYDSSGARPHNELTIDFCAAPLRSKGRHALGVLACWRNLSADPVRRAFWPLNYHSVNTFATALAPVVGLLSRLRDHSRSVAVVGEIIRSLDDARKLEDALAGALDRVATVLQAEDGAVYTLDPSSRQLQMVAGYGPSHDLVGRATYTLDEGLVGFVAGLTEGKALNLRTAKEVARHPSCTNKYLRDLQRDHPQYQRRNLLGLPLRRGQQILGAYVLANLQKSSSHPEPYFNAQDEAMGALLAELLVNAASERERHAKLQRLVEETVRIEQSESNEDTAIRSMLVALSDTGFEDACLYLSSGHAGTEGQLTVYSISARGLKRGRIMTLGTDRAIAEAYGRESTNAHHDRERNRVLMPLRSGKQQLGVLQISRPTTGISPDDEVCLRGFASHLAATLLRIRASRRASELTERVLYSSRFVVAEAMASFAVHSIRHRLRDILDEIARHEKKREVRENTFLKKQLEHWRVLFGEVTEEINKALDLTRKTEPQAQHTSDPHAELQASVDTWYRYLEERDCRIRWDKQATSSQIRIQPQAFQEILSVLLVNAVQAGAKVILIRTADIHNIYAGGVTLPRAVSVEVIDDGSGIRTSNHEELFEPTYSTKDATVGTGLGLFIARQLARESPGELEYWPSAIKQRGAAFRLVLEAAEG